MNRIKIAIIGAGHVGSTIAHAMIVSRIAREIALIDVNRAKARGVALDIAHGVLSLGDASVYAGEYADCKDADLLILTAGLNRRPGETRQQLLADNIGIAREIVGQLLPYGQHCPWLIITNPVDTLTSAVQRWTGLPGGQVFGTGCLLDTSRMLRVIAGRIGAPLGSLYGFAAGEHGDAQFPLWSTLTVEGGSVDEYCAWQGLPWSEREKTEIEDSVRKMGTEIIQSKGATHFGIATCLVGLLGSVFGERGSAVASVSSAFDGEFGLRGVSLSVPSVITPRGVRERIQLPLSPDEERKLFAAAEKLAEISRSID